MTRGSGRSDLIDIAIIVLHETDKAVLVDAGGADPVWLPKSQVEIAADTTGTTATMPEWLAREKELI
jgi:hypothetical protein